MPGENNPIAYQNKDITSKLFTDYLAEKSFNVYGLHLPKIISVEPTNLPSVEANELRIDNLFLLEDGTLALVDYESTYADENKIKYLNYIVRTLKRNMLQRGMFTKIRMIVIYTADVRPEQTKRELDIGCVYFQLEEAFLVMLHSEKIEEEIRRKLEAGEELTPEEQMQFIILPLTYIGKEAKQACIRRCFEMAKQVEDEKEQSFLLSGLLVFTDKVIDREDSERIKRWISMTKVAQLFYEEKIAYGEERAKQTGRQIAIKMLLNGMSLETVASMVTMLTKEEVEKLSQEIKQGA